MREASLRSTATPKTFEIAADNNYFLGRKTKNDSSEDELSLEMIKDVIV